MRTKTLLLTAALVAAGVASSMAQSNVYSLNIVGYVNIPVTSNKFYMLNNPFDTGQSNNNIASVLVEPYVTVDGTNDAKWNNSLVYAFKQGTGYIGEAYVSGFGWAAGANDVGNGDGSSTLTLPPGKGFWFQPTATSTVTFTGSVVLGSTNTVPPGISQLGSAYAGSTTLSQLGFNGNNNDTMFRWYSTVPAGYTVTPYTYGNGINYISGYGWFDNDAPTSTNAGNGGGSTNGPVLNVGEGFFYQNTGAAITWPQSFTVN